MSYHEINIFDNAADAKGKANDHKAAKRKNVATYAYESVIIYDNTNGKAEVIFDQNGDPNLFVVESDGE